MDRRLKEAYDLKHILDTWFKESDGHTVTTGFKEYIQTLTSSSIQRVAQTFECWRQEILQSFMYPYNNGYIVGVNNMIKVMKRFSDGIKQFDRLKKNIL